MKTIPSLDPALPNQVGCNIYHFQVKNSAKKIYLFIYHEEAEKFLYDFSFSAKCKQKKGGEQELAKDK